MAKPQEKELSALELMIEHADSVSPSVAGMPKARRKRKAANDYPTQADYERDYDPEMYEEEVVYVGPGSRAKNRAAKAMREKMANQRVRYVNDSEAIPTSPRPVAQQPNSREVESALEDLFIAGEKSGDDIVKAIKEGNAVSTKTQKALEDWLEWEKREAFKEKNRAKSDPHGQQPGAGGPNTGANDDDNGPDNDSGSDLGDSGNDNRRRRTGRRNRRGRRYGRGAGNRRGPGRNLPRSRFPRLRGKAGALMALVGIGAATAGGLWLKERSQEKFEQDNAENSGAGMPEAPAQPQPVAQPQEVQRAEEAAKGDTPKPPSQAQDAAVAGASMLLAGASKKIPVIGPALGNSIGLANDMQHIDADETLTDAEKAHEKKKATGGAIGGTAGGTTGAIAGAWIGGTLGSVVPVVGTAAGAALGSLLGGILGDYFGNSVGEYVADKITDETDTMLADGEKDRKEKMEDYNKTTDENENKSKFPQPTVSPFSFMGMMGMGAGVGGGGGGGQYQGPMRAQPAKRYDSKQVTDIANKAIAEGGLGSVSEQFESGGRGVSTVSTGKGDYGGVSYGKHQLATNNGSMMNFLNSPEGKPFLERFGGLAPGTSQFNSVYKDVANTQGEAFDKAQSDYITRTHYAPLAAKMQNEVGVDLTKRGAGVKELMYSTAVQYGAGTSVISNALQGKDVNSMSDDELIKTIQDYKAATTDKYFKSSDAQTRQSVATRAQNEKDVLLKVAEADRQKKAVNTPKPVETEAEQDARIAARFPDLPKGEPQTYSETDPKSLPDFTGRGPVAPKSSPEEHERRLNDLVAAAAPDVKRIEPTVKPEETVARQPLVTEGDIARTEAPAPPPPAQAPAPEMPKGGAVSRPSSSGSSNASPSNSHSLDSIPVFMDDPMMNMITMGYM
ncbi:hypothetical protein pEaSNUABM30_00126 [Erwinia phage pEa_SNUABM_30]|uniref:Type VI secretion system spike protein VgrG3-like C-terminal domain-containing protein n=1 Tax=Erwinia phage pEa_SNUABM_30 TaxID=2869553 RepID=A0AAE8XLX6_9CAUD|nr:hypothetical protein MPK69_gp126 [Erwinia phage pEa_SNUABM_30]UAW53244.1 hypothetical protein pEaSNUABM30_00126 [Erwinia phage pEa_SNUABM_30]